ncbi:MAG: 2-oxoacid:acceptor oxidoreductase family protein [Parcubacteria group bacterium]|jgi:pyruvate ferredoxin oxidoreductase gamma subunit
MKFNEDIINIVFLARGGQGAKTATEIIAQSGVLEGKFVKAFPDFGPERSGAPIKTYLRISEKEIRTAEPINSPDVLVILDETILEKKGVLKNINLGEDGIILVNSKKSPKDVSSDLIDLKGKIYTIDASGLAMKVIGSPNPNVAIIGRLIKITELVKLSNVIVIFESIFNDKIGKELVKKNILAMEKAYDSM